MVVYHIQLIQVSYVHYDQMITSDSWKKIEDHLKRTFVKLLKAERKEEGLPEIDFDETKVIVDLDEGTIRLIDGEEWNWRMEEKSLLRV